jgi:hypothetical protein
MIIHQLVKLSVLFGGIWRVLVNKYEESLTMDVQSMKELDACHVPAVRL